MTTTKHDKEAFCIDALRNENYRLKLKIAEQTNSIDQWGIISEAMRREINGLRAQIVELKLAGKFTNAPKVIAS